MDFELIISKENNLVKQVRKLISSSKERRKSEKFVLEGLRLCADAALNGYKINTLIVSESVVWSERLSAVYDSAVRRVRMPDNIFKLLCDTVSPQGILCVVGIPDIIRKTDSVKCGKYIVLENTADPANLGAIARTAEALGISGIITSSNGCDPFSPKSQRAAMGALLRLPLYISDDIIADVKLLKNKGFTVYASVVTGADCDISDIGFPDNCAVLIGNEANGLTEQAVNVCDKSITITMNGRAESLNAAAAASILMWEMTRSGVK